MKEAFACTSFMSFLWSSVPVGDAAARTLVNGVVAVVVKVLEQLDDHLQGNRHLPIQARGQLFGLTVV